MMIGRVVVLEPAQYEQWLKTGGATATNTGETPEMAGARLFQEQRCVTCHQTNGIMAPVLQGLYGKEIELQGGQKVTFDEAYIRESILNPTAKVTAGYQPVMPTFQGQVTEDAIMQLIAYIKSLGGQPGAHVAAPVAAPPPVAPPPAAAVEVKPTEEAAPTPVPTPDASQAKPEEPQASTKTEEAPAAAPAPEEKHPSTEGNTQENKPAEPQADKAPSADENVM